ncbi:MAG: polysaccharide deacetylase [Clostridia bacterium]|nr:polysaccharide deacetylase [Clostridia bacterium]
MPHADQSPTQTNRPLSGRTKATFGSVQFFRQLILTMLFIVLPLSLVALVTLSILFVQMQADLQGQINKLHTEMNALMALHPGLDETAEPSPAAALELTTDTSLGQANYQGNGSQHPTEIVSLNADLTVDSVAGSVQNPTPVPAKLAYLTFDDGPSPRTTEILDVLDAYQVKATFFVTNPALEDYPEIARDLVARGHAIGLHTASHRYNDIYQSVDLFISDITENFSLIEKVTGVAPSVLRFPGGSVNAYNEDIAADLIEAVAEHGYTYFDWNCASGDAVGQSISKSKIVENVHKSRQGKNSLVILFHDSMGKKTTVQALPEVIEDLRADGYEFAALAPDSVPVRFANIPG